MDDTATQSGSAATGPASFSDASLTWSDAPPASTPTTDGTLAANASADATAPPATDAPADGSPQQMGEPPKERWNDILANARTKAAEEALAPVAWARDIPQQEFQQIQQLARTLSANPIEGLQQLIAEVRKDPRYDAELKSLAARALSHGRQQAADNAEPEFLLPQADGSIAFDPNAFAQWKQWNQRQLLAAMNQELQPLKQSHEQQQQAAAAAQEQQRIDHFASSEFAEMQTWQGMDSPEAHAAVANEMAAMRINPSDPNEVRLAARIAWQKVIVPTLSKKAEATMLDSLKRNAAAASSINPGSAAASTPKSVTRFSDLPADAWR